VDQIGFSWGAPDFSENHKSYEPHEAHEKNALRWKFFVPRDKKAKLARIFR